MATNIGDSYTSKYDGPLAWQADSACAPEVSPIPPKFFFSHDKTETSDAIKLCRTCPVREECLRYALENDQIWGVWGGNSENDIRRTLSLNAEGNEVRRSRFPSCPSCKAPPSALTAKTVPLPAGGRWMTARAVVCSSCGFEWKSRTSANAVTAYYADKAVKAAKQEREREKARRKKEAKERAKQRAHERYLARKEAEAARPRNPVGRPRTRPLPEPIKLQTNHPMEAELKWGKMGRPPKNWRVDRLIEMGLIDPPEGYEPPKPTSGI